ncbi:FHA domain-containing protein [Singulisphaera sp. PoT]|uniref:FHA domain-containing protein n=1 Tax=Singulisphaera sp. PoT TaxID=3411797 RepID=UPI003BF5D84E
MNRSWVIGGASDCDHVVRLETVSGRHCRLTIDETGAYLEDLRSTNGTYVNGSRLVPGSRMPIRRGDSITLGQTIPLPWPPGALDLMSGPAPAAVAPTITTPSVAPPSSGTRLVVQDAPITIGRGAECDRTFDMPMVSTRHARISRSQGALWIEDLNSANGTFVNGARIERPTQIRAGDRISLGSYVVTIVDGGSQAPATAPVAATRVEAKIPPPYVPPTTPAPAPAPAPAPIATATAPASVAPATSGGLMASQAMRLSLLAAQAPVLGILLVVAAQGGMSIPAALFGLAIGSVWFGLTAAIFGGIELSAPSAVLLPRLLIVVGLVTAQTLVALVLVWMGLALKGNLPLMHALLWLAGGVGLGTGLLALAAMPRGSAFAWLILPPVLAALLLFGGQAWRLPQMGGWAQAVAGALPSRWAFEGVLLLESGGRETPGAAADGADLAEPYFPAKSERMGAGADAMALASMLIGLLGTSAFLAAGPSRRSSPATSAH